MMDVILTQIINGIVWGVYIGFIAVGLWLIFGLTEIINVAHGELFMLGGVFAYLLMRHLKNYPLTVFIVVCLMMVIGYIIAKVGLTPIEGRPTASIIATFGIGIFIQHIVLIFFGPSPRRFSDPINIIIQIGNFRYPLFRILIAVLGISVFLAIWFFLQKTKWGLWIQAVQADKELALSLGMPVNFIYEVTFAIGTSLAAFAGALAIPIMGVEYRMGVDILPLSFLAVIVGGMRSLGGTIIVSILMGIFEGIFNLLVDPIMSRTITLLIFLIAILFHPQGIGILMLKREGD